MESTVCRCLCSTAFVFGLQLWLKGSISFSHFVVIIRRVKRLSHSIPTETSVFTLMSIMDPQVKKNVFYHLSDVPLLIEADNTFSVSDECNRSLTFLSGKILFFD